MILSQLLNGQKQRSTHVVTKKRFDSGCKTNVFFVGDMENVMLFTSTFGECV